MSAADAFHEAQSTTYIGQMLRVFGGWSKPSGRGLMMFRLLMIGSSSAAVLGLGCAVLGGMTADFGTLGFVGGSCVGFVGGSVWYYTSCLSHALLALDAYPTLMQFHLQEEFPLLKLERLQLGDKDRKKEFQNRVSRLFPPQPLHGMLISTWQRACPVLEELTARREAALVAEISQTSA